MSLIDYRPTQIAEMNKKVRELQATHPMLAQELHARAHSMAIELEQDLVPLYEMMKPWRLA